MIIKNDLKEWLEEVTEKKYCQKCLKKMIEKNNWQKYWQNLQGKWPWKWLNWWEISGNDWKKCVKKMTGKNDWQKYWEKLQGQWPWKMTEMMRNIRENKWKKCLTEILKKIQGIWPWKWLKWWDIFGKMIEKNDWIKLLRRMTERNIGKIYTEYDLEKWQMNDEK